MMNDSKSEEIRTRSSFLVNWEGNKSEAQKKRIKVNFYSFYLTIKSMYVRQTVRFTDPV